MAPVVPLIEVMPAATPCYTQADATACGAAEWQFMLWITDRADRPPTAGIRSAPDRQRPARQHVAADIDDLVRVHPGQIERSDGGPKQVPAAAHV